MSSQPKKMTKGLDKKKSRKQKAKDKAEDMENEIIQELMYMQIEEARVAAANKNLKEGEAPQIALSPDGTPLFFKDPNCLKCNGALHTYFWGCPCTCPSVSVLKPACQYHKNNPKNPEPKTE